MRCPPRRSRRALLAACALAAAASACGGEVDFTVDGVKYAPGAWPHPLWRLSLRAR